MIGTVKPAAFPFSVKSTSESRRRRRPRTEAMRTMKKKHTRCKHRMTRAPCRIKKCCAGSLAHAIQLVRKMIESALRCVRFTLAHQDWLSLHLVRQPESSPKGSRQHKSAHVCRCCRGVMVSSRFPSIGGFERKRRKETDRNIQTAAVAERMSSCQAATAASRLATARSHVQ